MTARLEPTGRSGDHHPTTLVAETGAYMTTSHDASIRRDVPAGTLATRGQAYRTWTGALVHDWTVDGSEGWRLGGDWRGV